MTTSHVGWMHIWRLGERARRATVGPEITDGAVLARKYFEEAVRLDPKEAHYLGFSERFREAPEDQWRNLDVCTGEKVDRPYRAVLEERIASAAANVEAFRRPEPAPGAPTLMIRSPFACMGCHQQGRQHRPPVGIETGGRCHMVDAIATNSNPRRAPIPVRSCRLHTIFSLPANL